MTGIHPGVALRAVLRYHQLHFSTHAFVEPSKTLNYLEVRSRTLAENNAVERLLAFASTPAKVFVTLDHVRLALLL
jgi:hypothetical protein